MLSEMPSTGTARSVSARLTRMLGVGLAAAAILAGPSHAAPPANDNFGASLALEGESGSVTGTTAEATRQAGEPVHGESPSGRSVWFRWTAPATAQVLFETCGGTRFDTLLAAYVGSQVGALSRVAQDDDSCDVQSQIVFGAEAGTTYRIAVDGVERAAGRFSLSWRLVRPPSNDAFASAAPLSGARGRAAAETFAAGREPGEPGSADAATVWYAWTAPLTGGVVWETCRSTFDTVLAAYVGAELSSLRLVAANDDACGDDSGSRIRFAVRAGVVYRLQVYGAEGDAGNLSLTWTAARRPSNDRFARAWRLGGASGSVSGSTVGALGAPDGSAVWYRWRAPRTMPIAFATCRAATFDTVVTVYRGPSLRRAVVVDRDDDGCRGIRSRAVLLALEGVEYRIGVGGAGRDVGSFSLTWGAPQPFDDPCRVPDVVHDRVEQAERALARANCRVGRIAYASSAIVPAGRVIAQFPKPFTRQPVFARVNLLVSRGA
jgi:hypothetical protein